MGLAKGQAIARAAETPVLLLNAPLTGQRLGYPELNGLDLLELCLVVFDGGFELVRRLGALCLGFGRVQLGLLLVLFP